MKHTTRSSPKGFTLIELLIVIAVIAILAAIAIPNLLSSRKAANESSAIASLRTLVSAQETFRSRQNPPTYSADIPGLGTLIDPVLSSGTKSGYTFTTDTAGSANVYAFKAVATTQGSSGDRSFYVDQTGVIRVASDGSVAATSSAIQ